ncbi:MAG TPA: MYXO-CTERM sorting domain-containing protein [Kofleriaceae bacterium]|nr:MYXO-CTERM sorting domain-containing protein [Kofleriaceae bacterium]
MVTRLIIPSTALLVLGCAGGDPLADEDDIAGWANSSSAFGVYTLAHEPLGFANDAHSFADPACPATSDDGTTVVITGGCEDSEGRTWDGEVTVVRRDDGWSLTFDGFGDDRFNGMARVTGTFEVDRQAADLHAFEADLTRDGGIESSIVYSGTVAGGYQGPTVWNGSGAISRDGVTINSGDVEAETVDQVRDSEVCPGEGVSGTTTMTSEEHTVVISYDGDTACDDADSARWSLDGEDQGLVEGVTCSAGGGAGGPAALLLLLAALWLTRRR